MRILLKKKKRIIYGGWAWHKLIENKNKKDGIYDKNKIGYPDIEFYSPDPVADLIEICDILHKKKFKYIEGREAHHENSYSLFVNFINFCDMSYAPTRIMNCMPNIVIDKIQYVHPSIIMIDMFRMYTDPLSSFWRVKKNMKRANKLLTYYPIKKSSWKLKNKYENQDVMKFIEENILKYSEYLVFGYYAFEYFKSLVNKNINEIPYIDMYSINYKDDIRVINKMLKEFNPKIKVKEYHPFFQFYGFRTAFYLDKKLILNVYDNYYKCIPYIQVNNIRICSFQVVMKNFLINKFYYTVYSNKYEKSCHEAMLSNIIQIRNVYLKKSNRTIFDKTPFQEFIINCSGEFINNEREWFLEIQKKIKEGKRIIFSYDPKNKKKNKEKFFFPNISGNENTSKRRLIY